MLSLDGFFKANRRLSMRVGSKFPHTRVNMQLLYEQMVAQYMNMTPNQKIVDVGAGKKCQFAKYKDPANNATIIGVDVSADEMAVNSDLDERIVADVQQTIPLPDAGVDLVVSRSTLEHLQAAEPFINEVSRILKPGGHTIHVFPSKYAPFSILNRLLPRRLSSYMLSVLIPGSKGVLGFPAYYDHCSPGAMERLLQSRDFQVLETRVGYYQSSYFSFFFPLYLLSLIYEVAIQSLNVRLLAANVLIVARKTGNLQTDENSEGDSKV